jgi:2'-5' RNA ligase
MNSLVSHYAQVVRDLPGLDEVGFSGLHLTIQGIGFTDETSARDVETIAARTQQRCAAIDPFWIEVGPAMVDPEAVKLPAHPVDIITRLRVVLRHGISDVWGEGNIPESMEGFRPHVTLAYSNTVGPISEIALAINACEPKTASVLVSAVSLISLNRDQKRYEWTEVASVQLEQ